MLGRITWVDYLEDDQLGLLVRLSARMKDGGKFNGYIKGTEPYIYVPEDEKVPKESFIKRSESGYESLFNHKLQKVVTESPKQAKEIGDEFSWTGEADVPYYRKVSIHDGLSGYADIPETEESYNDLPLVDIDDIDVDPDFDEVIHPRISIEDIEVEVPENQSFDDMVESASQPINVICSYDTYEEKYTVFYYDKYDNLDTSAIRPKMQEQLSGTDIESYTDAPIEILSSDNESDMLNSYIDYINDSEFDLISGWNYVDFDRKYIRRRMKTLDKKGEDIHPSWMSPFGETLFTRDEHRKIVGRPPFDMMKAFCDKLTFSNWRSKSLEYVSNEELGIGKIDDVDINYDWKNQPSRLIAYNIVDVLLTVALDDKNDIHGFFYEMADVCSIPITDVFYEKRQVDGYLMSKRSEKEILPTTEETEDINNAGGYVADPANGRIKNVGVSDLKSLYPSAMITWNLSTETLSDSPDDFDEYIKVPKVPEPKDVKGEIEEDKIDFDWMYASFDKEGILPRNVKHLFKKRNREKEKMYEAENDSAEQSKWNRKQGATKVLMNCWTGDTEILTPSGIINAKDIDVGDKVYSINPETLDLEVKTVEETHEYTNEYNEIYNLKTQDVDFKVTPNHKFLTKRTEYSQLVDGDDEYTFNDIQEYEGYVQHQFPIHEPISGEKKESIIPFAGQEGRLLVYPSVHGRTFQYETDIDFDYEPQSASRLERSTRYVTSLSDITREDIERLKEKSDYIHVQKDKKHGSFPVEYNINNWLELLGWYISEGSIYSDERTNCTLVSLSQKNEDGRRKIKNLLDDMGIIYSTDKNGIHISSGILAEKLKECGQGSYQKRIPKWIFELDSKHLEHLFWTLIEGDGDVRNGNIRYSTVSDKLKEDFAKLSLLCGYKPKIKKDSSVWRIRPVDRNSSFNSERNIQTEEHNGKVYCVTVEDNHTVYAGRNGKFEWVGQSVYGVASSKYWRLSNQFLGDAVTSTARYTLWKGKQTLDRLNYEHVYSDTDSHMFKVSDGSVEKQVEELKEVSAQMDKDASEILSDCGYNNVHPFLKNSNLHGDEYTCMKWEAEKLGIHLQLGRKKRYAQAIDWKEGTYYDEPKISISGFENARSDSMPITAELQEEVIRKVLFGAGFEEVSDYLRSIIEQIDADSPDVERFALPGSINKALEDYPNRQIPRASMWSNEHLNRDFGEGDDPFVYLVKETPSDLPNTDVLALEWNEEIPDGFKLDKAAIVERGVKKPIESIIREMGWNFNELKSGKKQQTMDLGGGNPFA